jgi:zinc transporter ZupT
MPWEHHSEPLAPGRVFAGRMARQILLVAAIVGAALVVGTVGFMTISRGSENLDAVDSFLEASMLLSGAGPLYTERTSTNELKIFSSLYALFSTLIVVSSVGILASPIVHRVLHRLHLEKSGRG